MYKIILGFINFLLSSVFLVESVLKYHGQILIKLDLPLLYINLISAGIILTALCLWHVMSGIILILAG